TTLHIPASRSATAVWSIPRAVAPPMSIVEQNAGVVPRNAAARDAHPWASPWLAGKATSTPSTSSRRTPQSSIACFDSSSAKPMALVPGSLPKRERPMPAIAYRFRSRAGSGMRDLAGQRERGAAHDLALAGLRLGPDVAVDDAPAVLVAHGGDDAL